MEQLRQNERSRAVVALLCVLLVAVAAFVEAAHFHPTHRSEQRCSVCVVAQHSVAAPAPAHVAAQSFVVVSQVAPARADGYFFTASSALFIRPPPSI